MIIGPPCKLQLNSDSSGTTQNPNTNGSKLHGSKLLLDNGDLC